MIRRSILQLASRSSVNRVPLQAINQTPSYLQSRRAFSASPDNGSHNAESRSSLPKIVAGGLTLGSAVWAAYYYGILDEYLDKEPNYTKGYEKVVVDNPKIKQMPSEKNSHQEDGYLGKTPTFDKLQEPEKLSSDTARENSVGDSIVSPSKDSIKTVESDEFQTSDTSQLTSQNVHQGDFPAVDENGTSSDDVTDKSAEERLDLKSPEVKPDEETKPIEVSPTLPSVEKAPEDIKVEPQLIGHINAQGVKEVIQSGERQDSSSLLDDYLLRESSGVAAKSSSGKHEDLSSKLEDYDGYITKDGKLVFDFLQAIHAAEKGQAELDARLFSEEKKVMKEKYEKELKDARVRELMYAEREAILDKELNKEKAKAAAALKSLQENLEEKLRTELQQKEVEAEQKLKEMQDTARAELAAAIAREKASQIEKMAEANLHINALCMAFYARSEEARQSHSVHKLALGALALEDALSKGLPIHKEIETLHAQLQGDKDSLISLVLSSLPEETQKYGTGTLSQLNSKFDGLKGTLRHYSLIPPHGGGILSHSLAYIASWLKVKEVNESGDGIESVINRVENLLAQGKLSEAAETLENGVKGAQAAGAVEEWVKQARNRAVTEQALAILQSYATLVSLTS